MPDRPAIPPSVTIAPAVKPSTLQQQFVQQQPIPKSITVANTGGLTSPWLHCCLYGQTDARKTVTAARFAPPEATGIILTRRDEQLIPLRDMKIKYARVDTADAFQYAIAHPDRLFGPEWTAHPDRTLIVDDATEAVTSLVESANTDDMGRERKDRRRSYLEAGKDLREGVKIACRMPQHLILIALAKPNTNAVTNEETIYPDLPPSMLNYLMTEMEHCFYIDKKLWKLLTKPDQFAATEDVDGKEKTFLRYIFAKIKLPFSAPADRIKQREDLDLSALWKKIKLESSNSQPNGATKK